MQARKLIDGASFGPDALKAIGQAFDEAWAEVALHFSGDPLIEEGARLALANAVLSVATDMARNYTSLPIKSEQVCPDH